MKKIKLLTLFLALVCAMGMRAQCNLVAVPDATSAYEPTQIANGGFEQKPTMAGSGANRIPNGTNQGWNTTETNDEMDFEWCIDLGWHTPGLSPIGNYCVEMNAYNSATLYQDLYTNGGDVIRWSLAHAARTSCGEEQQDMRVEVGAPLYDNGNIVYPSGINAAINTNIDAATKATFRSSGITNPTGNTYGFNGQNLEYLSLKKSDPVQWYYSTGVYVVPVNQPVTRFAFVSEDTESPDCGNLLDEISFSTLIGDLSATYGDNNSVVIKGYWGETDTSKKLIIDINGTTYNVDMSGVIGKNFVITMTEACYDNKPSDIKIYHSDYESAARTISVNQPISATAADVVLEYDGNAHTISPAVTVPESGYTLKYGISYGGINLTTCPEYATIGTYPIYYSVSAPGYTTYKGKATLRITKTAFPTNIPITPPTPLTLPYTKRNQTLVEAGSCTGYEMAYALGENGENAPTTGWSTAIPQGQQSGSYYVWYKVLGGENYEDSNPAYVVATIKERESHTVSFTVNDPALGSLGVSSAVYSEDLETRDNGTFALPDGWTNDNERPWVVENHTLKSGNAGQDGTTSTIQVTYNFTKPGKISFSYRVSSESWCDYGSFSIDGVTKINGISGSSDGTFTENVDAGSHTFRWWYSKDGSVSSGEDAFFIDNIVIYEFRTDITNTTCLTADDIEVKAIPADEYNYDFINWTFNDVEVSTDPAYTMTVIQSGTLKANFAANTDFAGSGTEEDPYLIPSLEVWNLLATRVEQGKSYAGRHFLQTADISGVTNMIGLHSNYYFSGVYDGGGHTLNLNINATSGSNGVGPFRYVQGATIKNLKTTGSVNSSPNHPSGLVGMMNGSCTIENCLVNVAVSGTSHMGGLIGHTLEADVTITGCAFIGSLSGSSVTGGLIGWGGDNSGKTLRIKDSYFGGTFTGSGKFHPVGCFCQPDNYTRIVTNSYYSLAPQSMTDDDGNSFVKGLSNKGKFAYSVAGDAEVTVALGGTLTEYNVSGITASETGILYNNVVYGGEGETVTLALSHIQKTDAVCIGYTADNGTLSGNALTMVAANSIISAEWSSGGIILHGDVAEDQMPLINMLADGNAYDVTLVRPVYRDGSHNTFCVPFDLDEAQIAASELNGAHIKQFIGAHIDGGALRIEIKEVTSIQAGYPYLVKYDTNEGLLNEMHFTGVTVNNAAPAVVELDDVDYQGIYAPFTPGVESAEDFHHLFVGVNDKIFWSNTDNALKPFRAYFTVKATSTPQGAPVRRGMPVMFDETEKANVTTGMDATPSNGQQPVKVIRDGRMYILLNERIYTVDGQLVK